MKRTLLLFTAGLIAASAGAQERMVNIMSNSQQSEVDYAAFKHALRTERGTSHTANKTTAAPRWYSYVDYMDLNEMASSSSIAISAPYLWNDTSAVMAYSGTSGITYSHNRTVSLALAVDPAYSGFNNYIYYPDEMKVTSTDPYTIDSIQFFGRYGYNPAKSSVVDTLRVSFVYGNGTGSSDIYLANTTNPSVLSNYGLSAGDTLKNYRLRYDPVTNHATGTTVITRDIILDNSTATPAWGDTLSTGAYYGRVALPSPVSIPAGNMVGASISFISGDASFVVDDTVFSSVIGYKYNMFRPYVGYKGTTSTPAWATYSPTDRNDGMFKTLPDTALGWGGQYIPLWFWTASSGPSSSQYPYINFHVVCPACGIVTEESTQGVNGVTVITSAAAYPNPATAEVNVPFTLAAAADVRITLSNMIGQVVSTQSMSNVQKGKAVFNTILLPAGLYTYSVMANGQKTTGSVSVIH